MRGMEGEMREAGVMGAKEGAGVKGGGAGVEENQEIQLYNLLGLSL